MVFGRRFPVFGDGVWSCKTARIHRVLWERPPKKALSGPRSRVTGGPGYWWPGRGAASAAPGPWKTVGDIIEEERAFLAAADARQAEEDRLAAEAQAAADARVAELRQALTLTIFDKGFRPSDVRNGQFEDFILIQAAYENTSGKDIRAFRGSVQFADLFGKEIYTTTLTISDPLAAGANATWSGQIRYNQFMADQQALRNTALEDMNIGWRPASIMFADGTTIGEPPAE